MASFQAGKLDDAEKSFKRVLQRNPSHLAALNLLGIVLTNLKRYGEAERYLRSALDINSKSDATLYNYGIILKALGRPSEALERFSQALAINPAVAETWNNRGTILNDLKRYADAVSDFNRATAINPNYADAFFNKGKSCSELKRFDDALAAYDKALALKPDLAEASLGRGNIFAELGRYDEAFSAYDKALALKPDLAGAWLGCGGVCFELRRYDEAFAAFAKALALKPDLTGARLGQGNVYFARKRFDEALAAYDKALELKPDSAEALIGRGNVFSDLKRYGDAFAAFDKALALQPDSAGAWIGRGNCFWELKRHEEAFAAFDKALALKPDVAEAWLGRGNIFTDLKRYDDALAAYDKALALKPDLANAWLGRGNIFTDLKRHDEAFAAYEKALTLEPDLAGAGLGRGNIFSDLKRYDDAFAAYDNALAIEPGVAFARGARLHAKMNLCNWSDFDTECSDLISSIGNGTLAAPFAFLAVSSSPEEQFECARLLNKTKFPAADPPLWRGERYNHDRIRVGYLSADYHDHPASHLLAGMFEHHDLKRFETFAISFGPDSPNEMRTRLQGAFDRFIDVKDQNDDDVAKLVRSLEIDIAVDLMGYTLNSRTAILAHRACPIQVNYLGFPGTMSADYIDYIIADRFVIPDAQRQYYSEKIVYLPDTFQANDAKRKISDHTPSRAEAGLPDKAFVFCAFNNTYKLTPAFFDIWMRLLRKNDGSVLWLLGDGGTAERNLRNEAETRGVDPARLIFAARIPYDDYLARYRLADLFLDAFPFNAGTTASDALWAGLPLVTCSGQAFASRMAGSLLKAIGMPEMVTESAEDYEAVACALARDPGLMTATKTKLERNRSTHALFDTQLFTRHIEAAYIAMHERHQAALPADHIDVPQVSVPQISVP